MDSLYIGDIPLDFKYASFDEHGNIILTNKQLIPANESYDRYIILNNNQNKFLYEYSYHSNQNFDYYAPYTLQVSNKWYDRPDCLNILAFSICVFVGTIFIVNVFTSIFKKGGLLSGLL